MSPTAPYSLKVAKLYPIACDELVPYAGVPTEELARRSLVNGGSAGKGGRHRVPCSRGVEGVLKDTDAGVEDETQGRKSCKGRKNRTSTTITTGLDSDYSTTATSKVKTGRKINNNRRNEGSNEFMTALYQHEDEPRLSRSKTPTAKFFSDIHALQPVRFRNQETSDAQTKGLGHCDPSRRNQHSIFQYELPAKREHGYSGCIQSRAVMKPTQKSNLKVLDGYLAPAEGCEGIWKTGQKAQQSQNVAQVHHLSGGAIPVSDAADSFQSRRKKKKDSLYSRTYRDLSEKNQMDIMNTDSLPSRSPSGCARRMLAPRFCSLQSTTPEETTVVRPSRRTSSRTAHEDQIWDLTMGWQTDKYTKKADHHSLYEQDNAWPPVPEKTHERQCTGVFGALHDPEVHGLLLTAPVTSPMFGSFEERRGASELAPTQMQDFVEDDEAEEEEEEKDSDSVSVRCAAHVLHEGDKPDSFRKITVEKAKDPVSAHFRQRAIVADDFVDTLRPAPSRFHPQDH